MKLFYSLIAVLLILSAHAENKLTENLLKTWEGNTTVNIPFVKVNSLSEINGSLQSEIWEKSARLDGFMIGNQQKRLVPGERGGIYLSRDQEYLYIAVVTSAPGDDPGAGLSTLCTKRDGNVYDDDSVEVLIAPDTTPDVAYQIIINSKGVIFDQQLTYIDDKSSANPSWNLDGIKVDSIAESFKWTLELAIPLSKIGNPKDHLKMNICRNWQGIGPSSINLTTHYSDRKRMLDVRWSKNMPIIQQLHLGNFEDGDLALRYRILNHTNYDCTFAVIVGNHTYADSKHTGFAVDGKVFVDIPAGKVKNIELPVKTSGTERRYIISGIYSSKEMNNIQRNMSVFVPGKLHRRDPHTSEFVVNNIGSGILKYYPGLDRVAVEMSLTSINNIQEIKFLFKDSEGKIFHKNNIVKSSNLRSLIQMQNTLGKYQFDVCVVYKDGKEKTFAAVDEFEKKTFEWENNNLGNAKIILPPFTPIKKEDLRVDVLMRQHTFNAFGLWNSLKIAGTEILASPMTFTLVVDGKLQELTASM